MRLLVTNIGRLFTATPRGVLTDAAVLLEDARIAWVGHVSDGPPAHPHDVIDVGGALVTPGLIDAHTHPVYAGSRLAEISLRSAGATYDEISSAGGGIRATVAATHEATLAQLDSGLTARLAAWLAAGTTTVEAKTGYHLDHDGELAAVRLLANRAGVEPRLEVTFLAAHDAGDGGDFAEQAAAAASWCDEAATAGARFVDVFCDAGYFTEPQAREVLEAGIAAGLRPRIHADELAHTGASQLAAAVGAVSADHLLCATEDDARALARAGVVATLCPVTALALGRMPPARLFADHSVTLALGTDHNPGMSGVTSMSMVVGLAVHALGLSVDEALLAATVGGARSVEAADRGTVHAGALADLVAWDLGLRPLHVWLNGQPVAL